MILIAANVPMHVPRSCPSDILLICAWEKPRSVIILNNEMKLIANAIIPRAAGAAPPQSLARRIKPTIPNILIKKFVVVIKKDFLAIMTLRYEKDVYKLLIK